MKNNLVKCVRGKREWVHPLLFKPKSGASCFCFPPVTFSLKKAGALPAKAFSLLSLLAQDTLAVYRQRNAYKSGRHYPPINGLHNGQCRERATGARGWRWQWLFWLPISKEINTPLHFLPSWSFSPPLPPATPIQQALCSHPVPQVSHHVDQNDKCTLYHTISCGHPIAIVFHSAYGLLK